MDQFYYMQNGQACGPVLLDDIKAAVAGGALPADVRICRVGDKEWSTMSAAAPASAAVPMFKAQQSGNQQGRKEYKILSQKDKWFSGKFDPAKLEEALNSYARQGWRVVSCASADINTVIGGSRQEMVIILERDA